MLLAGWPVAFVRLCVCLSVYALHSAAIFIKFHTLQQSENFKNNSEGTRLHHFNIKNLIVNNSTADCMSSLKFVIEFEHITCSDFVIDCDLHIIFLRPLYPQFVLQYKMIFQLFSQSCLLNLMSELYHVTQ